jgi:hypothetical protein
MDGNLDGNRDHHTNDLLVYRNLDDDHHGVLVDRHKNVTDDRNDLKMVVNHVSRNYVLPDQKMDAMTDGNLGVNRDHHTNDLLDGQNLVVSRVNRNYAPHDLMMDANLDAMNHHVKLMVYLNMNCDRMSHDHLRSGHLKMRHRDMNRMDEMNLDGKMKIHHDCRPKKDDPTHLRRVNRRMKVCPKMDDRQMI